MNENKPTPSHQQQAEEMNTSNPDHPHGPPDPRWITDEGRCLLCAYSYHTREIERLNTILLATQDECERLRKQTTQEQSLVAAIEGNDAGMSHADLVATAQMLRNGRKRWMDEANQLRAERDLAVKEANRRDEKWKQGIQEECGVKLAFDIPHQEQREPTLGEFIRKLRTERDELKTLLVYKDETATTFMNQVKKLQPELQRKQEWWEETARQQNEKIEMLRAQNAALISFHKAIDEAHSQWFGYESLSNKVSEALTALKEKVEI